MKGKKKEEGIVIYKLSQKNQHLTKMQTKEFSGKTYYITLSQKLFYFILL